MGKRQEVDLAIMRVSKQIADESTTVFYGENTFRFLGTLSPGKQPSRLTCLFRLY
jgi:hypothetical protein